MIYHYLAIALVKFARSPFTTMANILTLALGLACYLGAYGITTYWQSADRYHANADRLYVVGQTVSYADREVATTTGMSSSTVARYLTADFPEIERTARAMTERDVAVASGESKALLNVGVVDRSFLEMFDFEFLEGSREDALGDPTGVILTQQAAERLFGSSPALGESVTINNTRQASVTGVIAPVRQPSIMGSGQNAVFSFDVLAQWTGTPSAARLDERDNWMAIRGFTFITLAEGASIEALNRRLSDFVSSRVPPRQLQGGEFGLAVFPISDLTTLRLDSLLFSNSAVGLSALLVLLGLAVMTLVVAGVNYANLATAQAISRAKEIGMRKVVGASRSQVALQSWIESLLLTSVAAIVAVGLLSFAAPSVETSTGIDVLFFLGQGRQPIIAILALVLLVGFAAGAYPALVMSRVRPIEALQAGRSRTGSRLVQSTLVIVQFASASFLLILVTVTQMQRAHLEAKALAHHGDPIVFLNDLRPIEVDYETLKAQLARVPGVETISAVEWLPWMAGGMVTALSRSAEGAASRTTAYMKRVDYDYFSAMDINMVAGRPFDPNQDLPRQQAAGAAQMRSIIIDEMFARRLGFPTAQEAVGEIVYFPPQPMAGRPAAPAIVIGVAEAEVTRLEATDVSGQVYELLPVSSAGRLFPVVRIQHSAISDAVTGVTRAWDSIAPRVPAQVRFLDELFGASFREHERINRLFMLLAGTALIIAAIGQLGIGVHVTTRRRHEIGVRKVLGSSSLGIVRLLLVDLAKPVLIANIIAWPFAYLAAQAYLQAFGERMSLTPLPFLLGLVATLVVAWASVCAEVLKAARIRPAEVLRHA
ncbi:ABC transporter permease [Neorhizobium sp. DT-125]|uniref:ABC transporter permease n=1 Tax=Neorhizobium sp. DT-125 TaxID=3396163 RepID=UPI003F1A0416